MEVLKMKKKKHDNYEIEEEKNEEKITGLQKFVRKSKANTKKYVFGDRKSELKTYKSTTLYFICVVLFFIYVVLTYVQK